MDLCCCVHRVLCDVLIVVLVVVAVMVDVVMALVVIVVAFICVTSEISLAKCHTLTDST